MGLLGAPAWAWAQGRARPLVADCQAAGSRGPCGAPLSADLGAHVAGARHLAAKEGKAATTAVPLASASSSVKWHGNCIS